MKRPFIALLSSFCLLLLSACPQDQHDASPPPSQTPSAEPVQDVSVWFTRPGETPEQTQAEPVYQALCHWLDQARSSLDIAAFELDLPCVAESLLKAKTRGVKVRLVVDTENPSPELKQIAAAKIPIVGDERSAFMHNKFIVRDQQSVWTGSLNFTVNGVERNHNNALALNSAEIARLYQSEFEEMFLEQAFGPRSPRQNLPQIFEKPIKAEVLFAPEDPIQSRLLDVIKAAKTSIRFLAFSFTDDQLGKAMLERAKAGVKVSGVFESTGSGTRYSEYGIFKKAKLDVYKDDDTRVILHHKVLIIDDQIVVTGSYNFSRNAGSSNDENLLILNDAALAERYLAEFTRLYQRAVSAESAGHVKKSR